MLDPETGVLRREGIPCVLAPVDRCAVEEALRIRELRGGEVIVVSMAPPATCDALRQALAMGADEVMLLTDHLFAGADTLATSYVLAQGISKLGEYDLVLCGEKSLDGATGHVGPQVAEFLGIPHLTHVSKLEMTDDRSARATVKMDIGYVVLECRLPAVAAVQREINEPRLISLLGIVAARDKEIKAVSASQLGVDIGRIGLKGSPTQVASVFQPQNKRRGEMLQGTPQEMAQELAQRISASGVIE